MAHILPKLGYDYSALEPDIDAKTMEIHHDKHHGACVTNLNAALEKHLELQKKSLEDLLRKITSVPEDIRSAVGNNAVGRVTTPCTGPSGRPRGTTNGKIEDAKQPVDRQRCVLSYQATKQS